MAVNRREFLQTLGATGILYLLRSPAIARTDKPSLIRTSGNPDDYVVCAAIDSGVNYAEWIKLDEGVVTAFTGRTEMGQGLMTVLVSVLSQGLELPTKKVKVILGDTDSCPDDGPTSGSSATKQVGWQYWLVCEAIRTDLNSRGAAALNMPVSEVEYAGGKVRSKSNPGRSISIFKLGKGENVVLDIPEDDEIPSKQYVDPELGNVLGREIVSARLKFTGDMRFANIAYGGYLLQPYHRKLTELVSVEVDAALEIPGVLGVEIVKDGVIVIAESFTALQKARDACHALWTEPARPKELMNESEILDGAVLIEVRENSGNVRKGLKKSEVVLSETYSTQYASHAQLETDTAIATIEDGATTIFTGSQYTHKAKELAVKKLKSPAETVTVKGMPIGGGFGGKISNDVGAETAFIANSFGRPVKYIYTREEQFQRSGHCKESVVVKLTTGVNAEGEILARQIDCYQDEGNGFDGIYQVPNVLTNHYATEMMVSHAAMRGTSYVQDVFALESHMDQVAHEIGMDPFEFRMKNISSEENRQLLQMAADMFGYDSYQPEKNHGVGMAMVAHGGPQYGAVMLEISLERSSGKVKVERVCMAVNSRKIISRKTLEAGIRGAIMWGIGYALSEELLMNGHKVLSDNYTNYIVPRFSDCPREIKIDFFDADSPDGPKGCGEMPVIPVIPAIANAIRNITGIRFYSTPITPKRLRKAMRAKS